MKNFLKTKGLPDLFMSLFRINPIIVKEIRSRMRGPRVFITLTAILLAMGGMMYAILQILLAQRAFNNILSPQVGQALFGALAYLELFMICAITPAVTAGAISSEKEKQTYEMLMATPLSPTSILWGKLISALSYVLLLLFAGVPLASVVFIFGGVAVSDMLKGLVVLLLFAAAFGLLGIFFSALFGRTGRATVASFVTVVLLMIGPLFVAVLVGIMRNGEPPRWILAPSPISALSAALASSMGQNAGGGIFYALTGLFSMGVSPVSQTSIPRPLYHYTIPFYAVLTLILYLLSTRLVQPMRRWRMRARDFALGIGSVVLLVGLIVAGYFVTAPRYEWAVNPQQPGMQGGAVAIAQPAPAMGPSGPIIQKQVMAQPEPAETATPVVPSPTAVNTAAISVQTPTPVKAPTSAGGTANTLDEDSQADIYAVVAKQLFTVDNTFGGGKPDWQILYLLTGTDDSVGDPNMKKDPGVKISEGVQGGVFKRLMDRTVNGEPVLKVIWIDSRDQAQIDPKTGLLVDGKGVLITFGNIHPQKDGTVQVSASLYFASLGAGGRTYILTKTDGVWKISGTTGVEWIS